MRRKGVNYAKFGYIFTFPFVLAFLIFRYIPFFTPQSSDLQICRG